MEASTRTEILAKILGSGLMLIRGYVCRHVDRSERRIYVRRNDRHNIHTKGSSSRIPYFHGGLPLLRFAGGSPVDVSSWGFLGCKNREDEKEGEREGVGKQTYFRKSPPFPPLGKLQAQTRPQPPPSNLMQDTQSVNSKCGSSRGTCGDCEGQVKKTRKRSYGERLGEVVLILDPPIMAAV